MTPKLVVSVPFRFVTDDPYTVVVGCRAAKTSGFSSISIRKACRDAKSDDPCSERKRYADGRLELRGLHCSTKMDVRSSVLGRGRGGEEEEDKKKKQKKKKNRRKKTRKKTTKKMKNQEDDEAELEDVRRIRSRTRRVGIRRRRRRRAMNKKTTKQNKKMLKKKDVEEDED